MCRRFMTHVQIHNVHVLMHREGGKQQGGGGGGIRAHRGDTKITSIHP